MKQYIFSIIAASLILGGCSDNAPDFPTNSSVEENEESRISSFDIDPALLDGNLISKIGYANLKKGFFNLETYNAELRHLGSSVRCGLHLGTGTNLEDGEYLLTFSDTDGKPLEGMLRIDVKEDKVMKVGEAKSSFSLRSGSGTQEDPYRIGSARDFLTFLDDLRENELTNGRDVWFQQTADIELMDQSSTKPGRGYFGYSFAGHYDGGGYALKGMYYRGAENPESDTRIGIFPMLLDGATVGNVTISGVNISSTYADTGTLAGTVTGTVSISGIKMTGSVISDNATNVGAFIGRMEKGTFSATDIKLGGSVEGNKNVGGIIGIIENGKAEFSGITSDVHFYVEGYESIGGVVGAVNNSEIKIKDSNMKHVVSKEDADIRLICTTGGGATGGLIGMLIGSKSAELNNVTVSCPVGGLNNQGCKVGGLIGMASLSANLTLDGCRITSIVSGGNEIGGYIGHCEISGDGKLIIVGDTKVNYIIPDDSAAGIEGVSQVGGAIGRLSKTYVNSEEQAKIRIGINVKASDADCGGAIGKAIECTVNLSLYDMTSTTMQVTGNRNTGGMVGYANNVTITGSTAFDYEMKNGKAVIPDKDSFTPIYKGIVKGKDQTGGILGFGENVTLKALTSGCTVEAVNGENTGGIVGKINTSGAGNRFEDLVSKSMVTAANGCSNIGGIVGYIACDEYSYVTDCINFGEVNGGDNTGGIFGVYDKYLYAFDMQPFKAPDILWCLNAGEVSGANCVGGIIGKCTTESSNYFDKETNLNVYKCGNNGKVSSHVAGAAASGVAGIIGYGEAFIEIHKCSNNATITSSEKHKGVGGIAGSLGVDPIGISSDCQNVKMYSCVNSGTIDSKNASSHVGGILGFMEEGPDSHLYDCLNTGKVLNKHNSDNGGILGYVDHLGKIYRCVNLGNVEHGNATIGTHKSGSSFYHDDLYFLEGTGKNWPSATQVSSADIGKKESFPGLNFNGTWDISESGPILHDCPF